MDIPADFFEKAAAIVEQARASMGRGEEKETLERTSGKHPERSVL